MDGAYSLDEDAGHGEQQKYRKRISVSDTVLRIIMYLCHVCSAPSERLQALDLMLLGKFFKA